MSLSPAWKILRIFGLLKTSPKKERSRSARGSMSQLFPPVWTCSRQSLSRKYRKESYSVSRARVGSVRIRFSAFASFAGVSTNVQVFFITSNDPFIFSGKTRDRAFQPIVAFHATFTRTNNAIAAKARRSVPENLSSRSVVLGPRR